LKSRGIFKTLTPRDPEMFQLVSARKATETAQRGARASSPVCVPTPILRVRLLSPIFAHRVAAHLDVVPVVDQLAENAIATVFAFNGFRLG
jgi:hypothetical protein